MHRSTARGGEEMPPDLSPRGGLSRPRNWGQAVQADGRVQGFQWSGTQRTGKAQVSRGSGDEGEMGRARYTIALTAPSFCPTISHHSFLVISAVFDSKPEVVSVVKDNHFL